VKAGPKCSPKRQRRLLKSSFLGFIHFSTNRSSAGWALLPRMGKVTSDDFLCGREHSRISKCREIRSKTGSKTGLKRGPDQHPQPRKRPYTGKSSLQRGLKNGLKSSPKTTPKMMVKSTCKIASRTKVPTSHFSTAGLRQTAS